MLRRCFPLLKVAATVAATVVMLPPDARVVAQAIDGKELPVRVVPNLPDAAEAYFSPDSRQIICNAKLPGDAEHMVYTIGIDGSNRRRINDKGSDACSFFLPDGKRLIWTSTRDHLDWPRGDWSDVKQYPTGAEIYSSALDGSDVKRLTDNAYYDAEVGVSPDGRWVVFGRQIDGKMDLWRMRPDGSEQRQVTFTPDWQEGGAQFMPDSETILYRAWKRQDEGGRGTPMTVFTIKYDGTGTTQITTDPGVNWAPFPAPDGKHFAYTKFEPPRNFDVYMMNLETKEQRRMTYFEGFDGFPAFSPDGRLLAFSSGRDAPPGQRTLQVYVMDISSLGIRPAGR